MAVLIVIICWTSSLKVAPTDVLGCPVVPIVVTAFPVQSIFLQCLFDGGVIEVSHLVRGNEAENTCSCTAAVLGIKNTERDYQDGSPSSISKVHTCITLERSAIGQGEADMATVVRTPGVLVTRSNKTR